jgi:hypothetical protein
MPRDSSRLFYELLCGVRLGFLVVSPFRIACEFLHLLGAEAEAHPGYGMVPDDIYLFIQRPQGIEHRSLASLEYAVRELVEFYVPARQTLFLQRHSDQTLFLQRHIKTRQDLPPRCTGLNKNVKNLPCIIPCSRCTAPLTSLQTLMTKVSFETVPRHRHVP